MAVRRLVEGFFTRRRKNAEERIVLALWALSPHREPSWSYGLDLMRIARLRAGRFYPALGRLEAAGAVEAQWDPAEPNEKRRRRMYRASRKDTA
jgi:DNA-binding PadR family transcriptional regulator